MRPIENFPPAPHRRPTTPKEARSSRRKGDLAGLDAAQVQELYRALVTTRRLEEHLVALYRQNEVVGGVYRSLGQEATAVGCAYGLKEGDFLQPLIRDLGALVVHGVTPIAMMRQYMARVTGPSGGRDLNTHFSDPEVGVLGPVSMLGAMVPVLAGCLLAARMKGEAKAGLVFIGDGGSSTGAFYEGVNFAAVQRLPLIVVIEANRYAYSTPTEHQVPGGDLIARAMGYGSHVAHVDGNDVLACFQATSEARRRGLGGEGPTLIVAETYRRRGHAEHDNQSYVPEGEIDLWAEHNDPVTRFEEVLDKNGLLDPTTRSAIAAEVDEDLTRARSQAVSEGFPDPATLTHGVFEDGTRPWPDTGTWFAGGAAGRART